MKHRVLVVDDDKLVADTLNLIFLANGFQSEARYSAAEALERARSFEPQLLLCDVSMPDATGLQLIGQIHRELPDMRLLMLTAYSSNAERVQAYGFEIGRELKLLNKPCHPEVLLSTAKAMLSA